MEDNMIDGLFVMGATIGLPFEEGLLETEGVITLYMEDDTKFGVALSSYFQVPNTDRMTTVNVLFRLENEEALAFFALCNMFNEHLQGSKVERVVPSAFLQAFAEEKGETGETLSS